MPSIIVRNFNLATSLESGQFFRYQQRHNSWAVVEKNHVCVLQQQGSTIVFDGWPEAQVRRFFDLGNEYDEMLQVLSKDSALQPALAAHQGLRLLRQDPWECLVAFVLSSVSNIPRIKKSIDLLADGVIIKRQNFVFRTLPRPGHLHIPEKGLGFRAKYISEVNTQVTEEWLVEIGKLSYDKAKKELTSLLGVGDKIADCVLLFAYGKTEAFPVDVWIQRVMQELYCPRLEKPKDIAAFGQKQFGVHAGYAQQFLYHWRRMNSKAQEKQFKRILKN